jgi:hypothetical protein
MAIAMGASRGLSVAAARRFVRELAQPGDFSHCDAAAAAVDRVTQRQILSLGHRPQGLTSAPLSVADDSIAFTERGQYTDCQSFEPALPSRPAPCAAPPGRPMPTSALPVSSPDDSSPSPYRH